MIRQEVQESKLQIHRCPALPENEGQRRPIRGGAQCSAHNANPSCNHNWLNAYLSRIKYTRASGFRFAVETTALAHKDLREPWNLTTIGRLSII